jgi:hypothetical protein
MSGTIVQFYLTLRNAIKVYHWNTNSYSRHKATDNFIEKFDALTDRFVEVYMGRYGRSAALGKEMTLTLPALNEKLAQKYLEEAREWMMTKLPKMLKNSDTDLINIRDEILGEINQTLYLFTLE